MRAKTAVMKNGMKILLVGAISVTLVACSCPRGPGEMLESCTSTGCFHRSVSIPSSERKPTPVRASAAARKVNSKKTAKTARSSVGAKRAMPSSQSSSGSGEDKTVSPIGTSLAPAPPQPAAKEAIATKIDAPASSESHEVSDPILKKALSTIAAKMEDPTSTKFVDMKRAIRHDTFGQPVDTICGHVRGKRVSGEETGERPFLYVVNSNVAFVDYGIPNSAAGAAYRNICTDVN